MHIVHLSTRLDYYGGEVCLVNLVQGLAERGHEVSCLVRPDSALAAELTGGKVRVLTLPMIDWFDPGTVRRVGQCLRQLGADLLATHLPRDYFIAAVAGRGLPLTNVATRHQLAPLSLPLLKRPFLRQFGAFIAVSEAVAQGVLAGRLIAPERVTVIPNGIPEPGPCLPEFSLRARFGLAVGAPVVGLVGGLAPAKGADVLLQAVALLGDRHPEVQVILVGDGGQRDGYLAQLRSLAAAAGLAGRVHFAGYVPRAGRHSCEFDVQVVASHAEPFGLVTIEAMAAGVPVIATATGGTPEILREGQEGFLVRAADAEHLAARLHRLLSSATLRREMGARGRRRYLDRYRAARMVSETEALYERLVGSGVTALRSRAAKA